MSEQTLRPRTVTELLDATFSLYRRNASAYIMVTAIAVVPGLIVQLLLVGEQASVGQVLGALMMLPISLISYALMKGVVVKMGSDVYLGGEADVAESVRAVLPRVGTLIAAAIFQGVMFFLYALMLLFPVLIAFAKWFGPEAAVVLEGMGASAAMDRSASLSEGHRMRIFGALALTYLIYFLLGMALGFFGIIGGSEVVMLFVQTLITIIAYPVVGLMTMLLYYDCRIRKEGFDVEHLAQSLGTAPAGPLR